MDNTPSETERWIFVEGIDAVIRLDLEKHKEILAREKFNLLSYQQAVSHAIAQKKHYRGLIGGSKFNDEALKGSLQQQNVNIRHLQDKVKLTNDAIEHHTLIVDTLTQQLKDYEKAHAAANRCVQQAS